MKDMDKLKIKVDKKIFVFLLVLMIVGITMGSILVTILNSSDKNLTIEYINDFVNNVKDNKLDYLFVLKNNLFSNLSYIILIWLLGISVIGLPIMIIMFFSKSFILGFSIGAVLETFKAKGIIFSLVYVFPGQVINLLFLLLLMMYAMSFSFKLIYVILKKQSLDFKLVMNRYFKIFLLVLIVNLLMTLYDTFLMPKLIKLIIPFIMWYNELGEFYESCSWYVRWSR